MATVTRATRDGVAVAWEDVRGYRMGAKGRVLVIQSDRIDKADVLRVAREHHWPGHADQPMPFDSLDELRDALRPYLRS